MSLIGKNPFVNEVLTSCSAEQLTSLSALINNLGSPTVIKLKELKNTDKGVKYASVFLDDFTLVHGLWIFTNTKCGLFAFQNGFDEMQAIRIDTVNKNYEYVYQHLSVTEFRSTLDDCIELKISDVTDEHIKNVIENNKLSKVESNFVTVDDTLEIGEEAELGDNLKTEILGSVEYIDRPIHVGDIVFGVAEVPESLLIDTGGESRAVTNAEKQWILSHYNYTHLKVSDVIYPNTKFYTGYGIGMNICSPMFVSNALYALFQWSLDYIKSEETVTIYYAEL